MVVRLIQLRSFLMEQLRPHRRVSPVVMDVLVVAEGILATVCILDGFQDLEVVARNQRRRSSKGPREEYSNSS